MTKKNYIEQRDEGRPQNVHANECQFQEYEFGGVEIPITQKLGHKWYRFRGKMLFKLNKRCFMKFSVGEIMIILLTVIYTLNALFIEQNYKIVGKYSEKLLFLSFLLSMRNGVFTFLFGISYERQLFWHKFFVYFGVAIGLQHWNLALDQSKPKHEFKRQLGLVMTYGFFILIFVSQVFFRRLFFNLFLVSHIAIVTVISYTAYFHKSKLLAFGFLFFLLDMTIRYYVIYQNKKNVQFADIQELSGNIILLKFNKNQIKYRIGQYFFLCIPQISYFEWHPISIATAPNNDKIELYIKDSGDWGHKLLQIAQQKNPIHKCDSQNQNQDQIQNENENKKKQQQRPKDMKDKDIIEKQLKIYLGGPYGNPGVDLESLNYKIFLIIAGGIGVTPMLSTVQGLMDQVQRGRPIKKIYFIWSNKDEQLVSSIVSSQIEQSDKIKIENKQNLQLQQKLDNINVGQEKSQIKNVNTLANNIDNSYQNNQILNEEFYLTQLNQLPNNNTLQEKNLLQVKNKLKVGKPKFDQIFDEVKKMAIDQNQRYVAVLSCGPQKLMNKVYEQCKINSDNKVDFYYHSEEFEF